MSTLSHGPANTAITTTELPTNTSRHYSSGRCTDHCRNCHSRRRYRFGSTRCTTTSMSLRCEVQMDKPMSICLCNPNSDMTHHLATCISNSIYTLARYPRCNSRLPPWASQAPQQRRRLPSWSSGARMTVYQEVRLIFPVHESSRYSLRARSSIRFLWLHLPRVGRSNLYRL
jgi:hypothetical protein